MDPNEQDPTYIADPPGSQADPNLHNFTEQDDGSWLTDPPGVDADVSATNFSHPENMGPPTIGQQVQAYQNYITANLPGQTQETGLPGSTAPQAIGQSTDTGFTGEAPQGTQGQPAESPLIAGLNGGAAGAPGAEPTPVPVPNTPGEDAPFSYRYFIDQPSQTITVGEARAALLETGYLPPDEITKMTPAQIQRAYTIQAQAQYKANGITGTTAQTRQDAIDAAQRKADADLAKQREADKNANARALTAERGAGSRAALAEQGSAARQAAQIAASTSQADKDRVTAQQTEARRTQFQTAIALLQHSSGLAGAGNLQLAMKLLSGLLGINVGGGGAPAQQQGV